MSDCLFCRIAGGEIPSVCVFENEYVYAFRDIHPQAPSHILVIPKEHIESAGVLNEANSAPALKCLEAAALIAKREGLTNGFRLISNCGPDAGQTVSHLHFHILGGTRLSDKMA